MILDILEEVIERIDSIDLDEIFVDDSDSRIPQQMPQPGDAVGVNRDLYKHYGIYCGGDKMIHYSSVDSDIGANNQIRETSFAEFLRGTGDFFIVDFDDEDLYPQKETIKRARSRLNEQSYNFLINNCEHFVHWCGQAIQSLGK